VRNFLALALVVFNLSTPTWAALPDESASSGNVSSSMSGASNSSVPLPPSKRSEKSIFSVGIVVKASTLGVGGEVAVPVTYRSNLRLGFNLFNYSDTFTKDGVNYKGTLNLRSVQAMYDIFLLGGLHLSPGVLLYNGNNMTASANVPGGRTFTLNNVNYLSDPANPVTGTGKLAVYKAAPMLLLGFGNLVPRSHRHFSASMEVGAVYQGPPRVTLNLGGNVCDPNGFICTSVSSDPTVQRNIVAEQNKLNKSASPFRFYPIISFGFGFKF
jgi:hypothetical protein